MSSMEKRTVRQHISNQVTMKDPMFGGIRQAAAVIELPAELSGNYNNEKRIFINIAFCDFVLQNFDSENFGIVFPKFSFFEEKWSV